jgi:hypothetical protein
MRCPIILMEEIGTPNQSSANASDATLDSTTSSATGQAGQTGPISGDTLDLVKSAPEPVQQPISLTAIS